MSIFGSQTWGGIALVVMAAVAPQVHAAYPTKMDVIVEFWNDSADDLYLSSATWLPRNTDLSSYVMPGDVSVGSFGITLNNPRNDSATFVMKNGERMCEFNLGHQKTFSWFSLDPSPEKFASATSVGGTAAQCSASVIKGLRSMSSYTVRVKMN